MARGDPRRGFGEPRRVLLLVVAVFLLLVVLTDSAAMARALVAGASVLLVLIAALVVWSLLRRRRFREGAAVRPFRSTGPEPDHDPMRTEVAALEAEGYVVEVFGRNALDEALIVLGHPDGSVATVASGRVLGRSRKALVVSSCLVPDRQWLLTGAGAMTQLTDAFWGDALPGTPTPEEVVRRHGETRAWFLEHGVAVHPVDRGRGAEDVVARIRVAAADPGPPVQLTPLGDRRHRSLAEVPGADVRLQALREAQVSRAAPLLGAVGASDPAPSSTRAVPSHGVPAFPSTEADWAPRPAVPGAVGPSGAPPDEAVPEP